MTEIENDKLREECGVFGIYGHAEAARLFGHLPPSHQREYLKWIAEAKKPVTREKRVKDMLARLMASKGA